jgi:hypothetical protein
MINGHREVGAAIGESRMCAAVNLHQAGGRPPLQGYWRLDELGPHVYGRAWADTPARRRALQRATRQIWLKEDRWPGIWFGVERPMGARTTSWYAPRDDSAGQGGS